MVRFTPIEARIGATNTPATVIDHVPDLPSRTPVARTGGTILQITSAAYDEARRQFPGYDIDYLEGEWRRSTQAKVIAVRHPDKAFMAWCRTYTDNNPL